MNTDKSFSTILREELNPQQTLAVLETNHPVLVLSGAGTGKTRTISYKVAYLVLEKGYELHRILALTFTNKAAREMRERTLSLIAEHKHSFEDLTNPNLERQLYIGTFHSICAKILRWHAKSLGYTSSFSIFDEDDQNALIKRLVKEKGYNNLPKPKEILGFISYWKNDFLSPSLVKELEWHNRESLQEMADIYKDYEFTLKQSNAMDFDDIQLNVIILFQQNPEINDFWKKQFQAILVDEFQDTNKVQYLLLQMLLYEDDPRVTFVGDDDQSIYSFRGAYIGNILNLSSDFPSLKIIKLEENYRSSSAILQLANQVIAENTNRLGKNLFAFTQKEMPLPHLFIAQDEEGEVEFCLKTIEEKSPEETVAIIYRTNRQSRVFERELVRRGMPYTLLGGRKFYEKKEIRDVLAYLRLIWNPYDQAAFSRIINVPLRGIGDVSRQKLLVAMQNEHLSVLEILKNPPKSLRLSQSSKEAMVQLGQILLDLQVLVEENPRDLIKILLGAIEYEAHLQEYDKDLEKVKERLIHLTELERSYRRFLDEGGTPSEFIEMLSLADSSDVQREKTTREGKSNIVLTSVHGCKGLEFDWVFVVGLAEEVFPHSLSVETLEQLEEERRLFYVAMTRAKSRLFLTVPRTMLFRGRLEMFFISRFLENIPEYLVTKEEGDSSISLKRWYKDFL